ncbi:enoyl-CoA-hydratase DpgB [Phytohabitans houttuyneae]|uniref:enoyl-CoA-hydratase DpgB n=1 Tax=Phytohabitans houttuyneae TaxID=1076126 RepID=UPI001C498978|nr:enoyl-CoA-hydratase DpgB [Phytohabitans houttuyneae]
MNGGSNMFTDVSVSGDGDVLVVRIDGADGRLVDHTAAVAAACDRAEDLDGKAIVVVQAAGAPAGARAGGLTVKLVSKWEQALRRLERLPAATIAVATGDCGGAALDALLVTDLRIAGESARLVLSTEGDLMWPGMSLYRLSRQLPAGVVRRAALFGGALTANEARDLHLVHEVSGDPSAALAAAVRRVAAGSGTELAVRRQLTSEAQSVGYEDALGVHLAACDRALRRAAAEATPA